VLVVTGFESQPSRHAILTEVLEWFSSVPPGICWDKGSARNGNFEVPVFLLRAKQGYTVRTKGKKRLMDIVGATPTNRML
jgi:hypothetical protein